VVVERGSDEWWWWLSGSGVEGGGKGDLSAVVVARVVELRGLVAARSVDWRWIGGGKDEGVGGRVAVVVK
jgi:hypothetical protein